MISLNIAFSYFIIFLRRVENENLVHLLYLFQRNTYRVFILDILFTVFSIKT